MVGAVGWGNASLQIPETVPLPVRELMGRCMERDPEKRPTFGDIIVSLRQIRAALPAAAAATQPPSAASAPPAAAVADQPVQQSQALSQAEAGPAAIESRHTF